MQIGTSMSYHRRLTLSLLFAGSFLGCLSYASRISVSGSGAERGPLSRAEMAQLSASVGEVAERFG